MLRLNILLTLAVIASALYLVRVQYESRRLYADIEKAQAEARAHEAENERLLAERRGQSTPLRVEQITKNQLQMRAPTPGITQYVTLGGAPAPAAAATPTAAAPAPASSESARR
jgi:cell division protein FtsL